MFKYIKWADMLKQIIERKKQLKQVIYGNSNKNSNNFDNDNTNVAASYSLLSLVTNNFSKFEEFIEKVERKTHSNIKNPYLMIVMVGEYVNIGKIKGGGKIKKIIMENLDLLPQIKKQTKINKQTAQIRLIPNLISNESTLETDNSFEKWKNLFDNERKFEKNSLIQNVYNLSSDQYKQVLRDYPDLLKSKNAVIQSFSSALPPFLLLHGVEKSNLKNFKVIDACSAPGNKTIQLGEYIHNQNFNRKVLAFEKDPKRFNILNRTISRFNVQKNIRTFNENFLETNPQDKRFKNVKFVLLDPSCSGSGMLSNYLRDLTNQDILKFSQMSFQEFCDRQYAGLNQQQIQRVQKLHDFQLQLLQHAATFKPKRISYSTCSIYKRQNQNVVEQFLKSNQNYFLKKNKVVSNNIGKYSICQGFGEYKDCVRMDPRKRETDGFFVSIFVRKTQKQL